MLSTKFYVGEMRLHTRVQKHDNFKEAKYIKTIKYDEPKEIQENKAMLKLLI